MILKKREKKQNVFTDFRKLASFVNDFQILDTIIESVLFLILIRKISLVLGIYKRVVWFDCKKVESYIVASTSTHFV